MSTNFGIPILPGAGIASPGVISDSASLGLLSPEVSTYTGDDAVGYVRKFIKNIPTDDIKVIAVDEINARMWRYLPWRWTVAGLTAIPLVDGTQDYGSTPTDYFRLTKARIARTDVSPVEFGDPLDVLTQLEPKLGKAHPNYVRAISYEGHLRDGAPFRLERAVSLPTGATYEIRGEYQIAAAKIADTSQALPFPDMYFSVFLAGLKWKFMEFVADARAGSSQSRKGDTAMSGARSDFESELYQMAMAEGFAAGDVISPSESLWGE